MNLKERIEEIEMKMCQKIEKMQYQIYPPEDKEYLKDIRQATTDILKAIRESLPKEKDYTESGGNVWLWRELRRELGREGYNQCLQEINEMLGEGDKDG